ncbi:MAG TPA: hypothetical protein EYQ44_04665 [Porticoccaceae bacterium]|nr:hypothetical protein [Porticoccaceae bacterium]HIK81156.1 hypothetical protein [Porticoccaceae bacterium]
MPKSLWINALLLTMTLIITGCNTVNTPSTSSKSASTKTTLAEISRSFADIPIASSDTIDIDKSLLLNSGEQWIGRAVLRSSQNIKDAFTYYQVNMAGYGWVTVTSVQSKVSVLTFEKASRVATVQIEGGGRRGSYISVTVSPREAYE